MCWMNRNPEAYCGIRSVPICAAAAVLHRMQGPIPNGQVFAVAASRLIIATPEAARLCLGQYFDRRVIAGKARDLEPGPRIDFLRRLRQDRFTCVDLGRDRVETTRHRASLRLWKNTRWTLVGNMFWRQLPGLRNRASGNLAGRHRKLCRSSQSQGCECRAHGVRSAYADYPLSG